MNTTTMNLQLRENDSVETFVQLLSDLGNKIMEAAQMLARLYHSDPAVTDRIRERVPSVAPGFLARLLKVGEGSMHPAIMFNPAPAYQRLALASYGVQEQVIKAGAVDVVINVDTGDVLRVPLLELTPAQVSQTITQTGVRPIDEQRALLRRQQVREVKPLPRDEAFPWTVKKDRVLIPRAVELTRRDIVRMLEDLGS